MAERRGAPRKYETPEEMADAIEAYFDDPPIARIPGKDGKIVEIPKVTITGLALALGFESRQSFYDYEKKGDFAYILKRARMRVEQEYENQLTSGGQAAGPIFALKQFGWRDNMDTHHSGAVDVSGMTPDQMAARVQSLMRKMNGDSNATEEGQQPEDDQQ